VKRLAILGGVCYLLALIFTFPPDLALRWLAPAALSMQAPRGSVWRGEAQAASISGYYLGRTHWSWRPLALLRGRLAYQIDAQGPDGFVNGIVGVNAGGNVSVDAFTGAASMQSLAAVVPPELPASVFQGAVHMKLDTIRLHDGWPIAGHGSVTLENLVLTTPSVEALGNYELQLDGGDGGQPLSGAFHDTDPAGALQIKGTITLNPDRSYVVKCTAQARPKASDNIKASVGFICPPS
jgi:general secretion pathway protein N